MTRDEALTILDMEREQAVEVILTLAKKAEAYDEEHPEVSPTTPSGMIPVYLKPACGRRRKSPGRKAGHLGVSRKVPQRIDHHQEHTMLSCPECQTPVGEPINTYCRIIEDIPEVKPQVTKHTVHGYWCRTCKKIVHPTVSDALPNAMIGLRPIVFTAWRHYLVGVSVSSLVRMVSVFSQFKIRAGSLTQAWKTLANLLTPLYGHIGHQAAQSAVLHADETGWRLNGKTFWLWCFTTQQFCYYLITKCRGSPVVKQVLGILFEGILICDFWGAYNKIAALAKQRCFYHLFTEPVILKVDKHNERHKHELFTFLEHLEVSPYNNHAEQQMRKPVLVRKVSQQSLC